MNILITGTSSGFGQATARALAAAGHRVLAGMRNTAEANAGARDELAGWAATGGHELEVIEIDITDVASVDAAVKGAGPLDAVVNNAGIPYAGLIEGFTPDQVLECFTLNALGAHVVDRAALPAMRERGSGLLIYVSTTAAQVFAPYLGIYRAAKAAGERFAEDLRHDLAPFGVDSTIIEAGVYPTPGFAKLVPPADAAVLEGYGPAAEGPQQMFAGLAGAFQGPDAPDPAEVAAAIQRLVDTPFGQRPLRTIVGTVGVAGAEELDRTYEQCKRQMLTSIGITPPDGG